MSRAISRADAIIPEVELSFPKRLLELWPLLASLGLALVIIVARLEIGRTGFLYEGTLTLLALVAYMSAAVVLVTNLFARMRVLERLGLLAVALGTCFNLAGWMIRLDGSGRGRELARWYKRGVALLPTR